ncbi:MAG: tRNA (adenosine(37)-N6)-threonylcarbamoyltransferase complex transferase subunit TsaD [Candidatus Margulisiibacteriota bacterium]
MPSDSLILGIETSCDETSVAFLENGTTLLSLQTATQLKKHQKFGGVVPELASRLHTEILPTLLQKALLESQKSLDDITHIAVTTTPGLEGSLLVGVMAAKTLALALKVPVIDVNHLHGHLYASYLSPTPPTFPYIGLIASGGHTQLVLVKAHFEFELLGQTRDDAAGEAFDKVGRLLELGYPGGPAIEELAKSGNPKAFSLPIGLRHDAFSFSFSGIKTAVMQTVKANPEILSNEQLKADLCASFQRTVIETLWKKTAAACEVYGCSNLVVSGGVTANQALASHFQTQCQEQGIDLHIPDKALCTDNAGMIAMAGFYRLTQE